MQDSHIQGMSKRLETNCVIGLRHSSSTNISEVVLSGN